METNMYDTEFTETFKEEIEKEASTYTDKARDEKEKKKKHFAFGEKRKVVTVSLDTVKVKK